MDTDYTRDQEGFQTRTGSKREQGQIVMLDSKSFCAQKCCVDLDTRLASLGSRRVWMCHEVSTSS